MQVCSGGGTVCSSKVSVKGLKLLSFVSAIWGLFGLISYSIYPASDEIEFSEVIVQALFQGVLSSVVALYAFIKSIDLIGSLRASFFGALAPFVTLVYSFFVLSLMPAAYQVVGSIFFLLAC